MSIVIKEIHVKTSVEKNRRREAEITPELIGKIMRLIEQQNEHRRRTQNTDKKER